MLKRFGTFNSLMTTQKHFLTKLGIMERAEIISKNMQFSEKADIYFRIQRLIDEKQMGNLFKVMLVKNINNKFEYFFGNTISFCTKYKSYQQDRSIIQHLIWYALMGHKLLH